MKHFLGQVCPKRVRPEAPGPLRKQKAKESFLHHSSLSPMRTVQDVSSCYSRQDSISTKLLMENTQERGPSKVRSFKMARMACSAQGHPKSIEQDGPELETHEDNQCHWKCRERGCGGKLGACGRKRGLGVQELLDTCQIR
jgi:hypothetical protein